MKVSREGMKRSMDEESLDESTRDWSFQKWHWQYHRKLHADLARYSFACCLECSTKALGCEIRSSVCDKKLVQQASVQIRGPDFGQQYSRSVSGGISWTLETPGFVHARQRGACAAPLSEAEAAVSLRFYLLTRSPASSSGR